MTFVLPMRIDPPNLAPLDRTERALDKVERAAVDTGKAVTKNMREGSLAADKAARSFKGVADAIKLEASILQGIRGPAEKYERHLKAIERMHRAGVITAKEYTRSLREARAEFKRTQEETGGAFGGGGGGGAALATGLGIVGTAVATVSKAVDAGDAATNQTNSLMRLTDTYHDLNSVRRDMLSLSGALHSDLAQTADLFDAVRDGAEGLGLSYKEQIELTKALGAVARLDNKSLQDSAGAMEKLSYAMASGKIESRELKGLMKEFPQLADVWTDAFDTSRTGLIKLVEDGKVSVRQLVMASVEAGPALEAELGKRPETWGVKWARFKDEATASLAALGERNDTFTRAVRAQNDGVFGSVEGLVEIFSDWEGAVEGARTWLYGYEDAVTSVVNATLKLAESHQDVIDKWERIERDFAMGWVQQSNLQIAATQKTLDAAVDSYQKQQKAAEAWRQTTEYAVLQMVRGPLAEYEKKLRAIEKLHNNRKITDAEYVRALGIIGPRSQFETIEQGGGLDDDLREREKLERRRLQDRFAIDRAFNSDFDKLVKQNGAGSGLSAQEYDKKVEEEALAIRQKSLETRRAEAEVIANELQPFADGLIEAAHGADVAWSSVFENLQKNIERAILDMLILKGLEAGFGLPPGSLSAGRGGIGSLFGGATSGAGAAARTAPSGGDSSRSLSVSVQPAPVQLLHNSRQLIRGIGTRAGARAIIEAERLYPSLRRG